MKSLSPILGVALLFAGTAAMAETTLRVGIQDDPDALDPARSRTYAGRLVFTALCDKLVDVTPALTFVPQLATAWTWSADNKVLTMTLRTGVTFHDGEPFDAAAVKFNLDRDRTLPDSARKSELASVADVAVVDPRTVAITLKQPDATLIAQLSDRAGMMLSPKASTGDVASKPVCSGPFKFVQRVQQDRIVLERYDGYWNKAAYHFDRVVYRPIPDTSVRLANLRSGDLDIIERFAPTDAKSIKADGNLQSFITPGLGYTFVMFNVANGERAKTPLGQDKRVREAFEAAIDRQTINDVVFEGLFTTSTQPFPPTSPFDDKAAKVPVRDVAKAQALLKAAGVKPPLNVEILVPNSPVSAQVGQIIQAMTAEAGFNVSLRGHGVRHPAQPAAAGPVPGEPAILVGPARPRRQHPPVRELQRKPQRRPLLQPQARRLPQHGAHHARRRDAPGALQAGLGGDGGRSAHHRPLLRAAAHRDEPQGDGVPAQPGRVDPAARRELRSQAVRASRC